jgi:hypothetical protein
MPVNTTWWKQQRCLSQVAKPMFSLGIVKQVRPYCFALFRFLKIWPNVGNNEIINVIIKIKYTRIFFFHFNYISVNIFSIRCLLNFCFDLGWVGLHEAASRGHLEVVELLLSLNAPARPRTVLNETPEQLAEANGHFQCAYKLSKSVHIF